MKKIMITSCETTVGAWRDHEKQLRRWLCEGVVAPDYEETANPEDADLILIGNLREERYAEKLRRNAIVRKYPNKCFIVNDMDRPTPFLHGIYASAEKSFWDFGRSVSSGYSIFHSEWRNPYVENYDPSLTPRAEAPRYLMSFKGRSSDMVRDVLFSMTFSREDVLVHCSDDFNTFTEQTHGKDAGWRSYVDLLLDSKFSLCPRGAGAASIRLFESMKLGVAPIIISDDWKLPPGPNWDEFSIRIPERQILDLEDIVQSRECEWREMGARAQEAYHAHFQHQGYLPYVIDQCENIAKRQSVSEALVWTFPKLYAILYDIERRIRYRRRRWRIGRLKCVE